VQNHRGLFRGQILRPDALGRRDAAGSHTVQQPADRHIWRQGSIGPQVARHLVGHRDTWYRQHALSIALQELTRVRPLVREVPDVADEGGSERHNGGRAPPRAIAA
jgi:hypothetical protein